MGVVISVLHERAQWDRFLAQTEIKLKEQNQYLDSFVNNSKTSEKWIFLQEEDLGYSINRLNVQA